MFVQHQKHIASEQPQFVVSSKDFELEIIDQSAARLEAKIYFNYLHVGFNCHIEMTNATIQLISVLPVQGLITKAPDLDVSDRLLGGYLDSLGAITQNGQQQIVWLMQDIIHVYNLLRLKAQAVLQLYRTIFSELKAEDASLVFGEIAAGSKTETIFADLFYIRATQKYKYRYSNAVLLFRSIQNLIQNQNGYFTIPLKRI